MAVADLETFEQQIQDIRAPEISDITSGTEDVINSDNMIGSDTTVPDSSVSSELPDKVTVTKSATEDLREDCCVVNGSLDELSLTQQNLKPDEAETELDIDSSSQNRNLNESQIENTENPGNASSSLPQASKTSDHGSSADLEVESESESETSDVVKCCPHAHQFVDDLSSEESDTKEDITVLRKERRQKKRRKRQQRLKKCCSGCDKVGEVEPLSPELPSPIALSTGMMQCNVIKSFEEVVSTRYDSEEEIDAAINSYSAVGGRLANQNERTFSDVDIAGYKSRSDCGSPGSDPDLLVCDYSNSVGRKLANRNLNKQNDNLDECIGGYLLDTLNQNLDPTSRLFAMGVDELTAMINGLNLKLQQVNEELVAVVKENDDLKAQKSVITKHVTQLSRLAQGIRANDNSAFRKILVTRETDI